MSIAGHVSRALLSRYSQLRMEAKRRALDVKRKASQNLVAEAQHQQAHLF